MRIIVEERARAPRIAPRVSPKLVETLKAIESKWQERWREARIFEADPKPGVPKYFVTFPYPYVNAPPHLGSAFTILRVDVTARYKRMRGYNVLFAQGWHATGGPIVAAALRLREGDPRIVESLKLAGVPESEIEKFREPETWVRYFTREWRRDLERYGMSIDWRREFFTTRLNPYYSKFIEWQYLKLRDKGLIGKGRHPVVWCPKEGKVVGDHDRPDEYVGIGPIEAYIIKFKLSDGRVLPALTLRPETVFGVTNIWVHPEASYLLADVEGELWVLNETSSRELRDQGYRVEVRGRVDGRELLGLEALNPATGSRVPVLPAWFVDPDVGTGMVMSVPAHAPFDLAALLDLKRDKSLLARYGLDPGVVDRIEPIVIIETEDYRGVPAEEELKAKRVASQHDRELLEEATRDLYSREFHKGVMLENTGPWRGVSVAQARESVASWLSSINSALRVYTLPQRVYCRCGSRAHVKIVEDQWFILYSREDWKKLAFEALESMMIVPREAKAEMNRFMGELGDWAFTHKGELGTHLPWDPEWVIESLSDSTIYMAYYALAKYLQHPEKYGVKPENLTPEFFDYVLLGIGDPREVSAKTGIGVELLEEIRREFLYWYPVDLRISGKDLLYNHLIFFIMHHVAIFPRELWPRGISVNGWVLVGGEKMSKSRGNFILLRQALEWWGADATRWAETLAGADSTLDDANFDPTVADSAVEDLVSWLEFARANYGRGRDDWRRVDDWFNHVLNETIVKVTELMEKTMYKSALVEGFYGLQAKFKWYLRRAGVPNRELLKRFIEVQTLLIAPFAPHLAEEVWSLIGKEGFVSLAPWPTPDYSAIKPEIARAESIVESTLEDAREILKLVGAGKIVVTVAARWKYEFLGEVKKLAQDKPLAEALREALRVSPHRERAGALVSRIAKSPEILEKLVDPDLEYEFLKEAEEFFSRELGVEVRVEREEEGSSPRKSQALPAKPAIYVEKAGGAAGI
ncbi:MAG: leucine--tRNA ligase [Acidilobaceae archaeon]